MDDLRAVSTFIVGLISACVLLFIHYRNRRVALEAVKISALTLMTELAEQRAYIKEEMKFIVEETFKQYYGTYISIDIIRKICIHKNASYAFLAYKELNSLVLYDTKAGKFNILSKAARIVRFLAVFQIGLLVLILSSAVIGVVYFSITEAQVALSLAEHIVFLFLGGLSGLLILTFFAILNRSLSELENLKKMKIELQSDVDETLTRPVDTWVAGILLAIFIVTALAIIFRGQLI